MQLSNSQQKQSALILNSGVNTSNVQNKQLSRVIINPFQADIIPNSCTNSLTNKKGNILYQKQNGNSMQNIMLKTSQSNVNLNTSNPHGNMNVGNIFNQQLLANNMIVSQNNNSSQSGKNSFMRFSVTSIQKQNDLPYIEQFNQIFESKKKNLYQMCNSNQQQTTPVQSTNQINVPHLNNHQSQSLPQNVQNNTFSQGTNLTQPNEEEDILLQSQQDGLSKRQKQIKIFTITSREGSNLIQNGLQTQSAYQSHQDQQHLISSMNNIGSTAITGLTTPSSNINLTSLTKVPIDIPMNSNTNPNQNSINTQRINSSQKSETTSIASSQVNINMNTSNTNQSNKGIKNNANNNTNTPVLKTNIQLKMSHKVYSGPTFNSLVSNKNSQATPIKSNNTAQSTKNKRQSTMSSDPACSDPINSINSCHKISNSSEPIQGQKFCNLNLDQNIYSSAYFDQGTDINFPDSSFKQSQTPSIGKNGPDNFHLLKQNYKSKAPYETINSNGQFINLNSSNSQQPVYSRISNAAQGSFSPLKLDSFDQRRQISTKNAQNFQFSIPKRGDNYRRKSINSAQNNIQQQVLPQQGGNNLQKATPPPSNVNRQKKQNTVNLQNQNQFVIKKNNFKNYENTSNTLSTNKSPA